MCEWRTPIRCYVAPGGRNKIEDWYGSLSAQEKSDADELLKNMRRISASDWRMPHYRPKLSNIKGVDKKKSRGLGELRWKSENKQHRLLGFFRDGVWYAVVGCTHKQDVYSPAEALATAVTRKEQIQNGVVGTVEYDL